MRQWLARLAFALLVIGFVLGWKGYRIVSGRTPGAGTERAVLYFVPAVICFALGLIGIRERHRPRE
jgi:hypothetical protein